LDEINSTTTFSPSAHAAAAIVVIQLDQLSDSQTSAQLEHGMEGFDYERARAELRIPDEFQVEAMAAVGKLGAKELLLEKLQKRESPNDRRKLSQSICEGPFRF
jgi:hypothetical protein